MSWRFCVQYVNPDLTFVKKHTDEHTLCLPTVRLSAVTEPWSDWVNRRCLLKSMYECMTGRLELSYKVDIELKDTLTFWSN